MITDIFEENKTPYRLVNSLENRYSLLCKETDGHKIISLASNLGYEVVSHPISISNGYTFGYNLSPFLFFLDGKISYEVFFQIPSLSLTKKYIIPLDKTIQNRAWDSFYMDNGIKRVCLDVELIYIITRCVFQKKDFYDCDIQWINEHKKLLKEELTQNLLKKVFFRYTERLIELIVTEQYKSIYLDYLCFKEY
jgi:hypothetical protein